MVLDRCVGQNVGDIQDVGIQFENARIALYKQVPMRCESLIVAVFVIECVCCYGVKATIFARWKTPAEHFDRTPSRGDPRKETLAFQTCSLAFYQKASVVSGRSTLVHFNNFVNCCG